MEKKEEQKYLTPERHHPASLSTSNPQFTQHNRHAGDDRLQITNRKPKRRKNHHKINDRRRSRAAKRGPRKGCIGRSILGSESRGAGVVVRDGLGRRDEEPQRGAGEGCKEEEQ